MTENTTPVERDGVLNSISEGDRIIWEGRSEPLTVFKTTPAYLGVKGPNGAKYALFPGPANKHRLHHRQKHISGLERVLE